MKNIEDKKKRFNILIQQLEIMRQYPDEFIDKLGGLQAFRQRVDEILDEMNEIKTYLKKYLN